MDKDDELLVLDMVKEFAQTDVALLDMQIDRDRKVRTNFSGRWLSSTSWR